MEIRKLQQGDSLEETSGIYALCWKTDYRGILPGDFLDALPEDRWVPFLRRDSRRLLLARVEGRPVGAATWGPARDPDRAGWGELFSIYLLPRFRRRGAGTALLRAALEELKGLGFRRVYLWVLEENLPARAFYQALGFSPCSKAREVEIGGERVRELRYTAALEEEG